MIMKQVIINFSILITCNFGWKILELCISDGRFKKIYISFSLQYSSWHVREYITLYGIDIFLSNNNRRPDVYKLLIEASLADAKKKFLKI